MQIADLYRERLQGVEELEMPPLPGPGSTHAWHPFILRLRPEMLDIDRKQMIEELKKAGIGTSVHFIPLHRHPYYREQYGCTPEDFPNAEDAYSRCLSLPVYPDLKDAEAERVIGRRDPDRFPQPQKQTCFLMSVGSVSNLSYVPGPDSGLSLWNFSFGKRFFDAVFAATGLLLALPLMAIIAVAIRVSMPGPILFRQLRVGRDARLFHILKFRTMRVLQPGSAPKSRAGEMRESRPWDVYCAASNWTNCPSFSTCFAAT